MYFLKLLQPLIIVAILMVISPIGNANTTYSIDKDEARAFASFITDLAHSTQSPNPSGALCYIGDDAISRILAQDKHIIALKHDAKEFCFCKAVYFAASVEKDIRPEVIRFNQDHILTLAIFDGFTEENNGMVQILMGRRSFELILNYKAVKQSKVRLSALAMSLVIN